MKDVVGKTSADTGNRFLVAQHRVQLSAIGPGRYQLGETVVEGFGPQLFQGAEVVGFKHPPRGLALGSVLANEHGCSLEGKPHDTSLGSRCLRRFLDKDAATLRQVNQQIVGSEL